MIYAVGSIELNIDVIIFGKNPNINKNPTRITMMPMVW